MLLSFIHPNLEIDYGSELFIWDRSKGRTKLPEMMMNIGLVWFVVWFWFEPVPNQTMATLKMYNGEMARDFWREE